MLKDKFIKGKIIEILNIIFNFDIMGCRIGHCLTLGLKYGTDTKTILFSLSIFFYRTLLKQRLTRLEI